MQSAAWHFSWPRSLAPALVASFLFHAAVLFALASLISTSPSALGREQPAIAVRLVAPKALPPPAERPAPIDSLSVAKAAVPVPRRTPAPAPQLPAVPAVAAVAEPPPPVPPTPESRRPAVAFGHVDVRDDYTVLSSLDEALVARSQSGYLIEIETPVRVLRRPEAIYPPEALAAQRGGTVTAWLAIDREGQVEDVVIASGEPEFVEAVQAALPDARFLPAEERGERVPFYIVLVFEFRSAAPAETAGTEPTR